ncbi:hypothetical protein HPB50_009367 [Hyalomma asiaticum]|uniref:Uncharacterized protein n=1 Tax=Hyalomma asiaticum TaxID=266040 RepID=A0ACB7S2C7_HYAAI|nr:hypothetical protein HPB50_009367 [Hyalomma asiaticum]
MGVLRRQEQGPGSVVECQRNGPHAQHGQSFPSPKRLSTVPAHHRHSAFVKNVEDAEWSNTAMDSGSDRYVLEARPDVARNKFREFIITDCDHFRKLRGNDSAPILRDLEDWCERIKSEVGSSIKKIVTDLEVEKTDSRLAHLIEAKQALYLRRK